MTDLVAQPQSTTAFYTGSQFVDYAMTSVTDIGNGDVLGASINGGAAALGLLGSISDPIAAAGGIIAGWAMEHIEPLRHFLDWLGGKPDLITSFSQTWANASGHLDQAAATLVEIVQRDTAAWRSPAIEAYRGFVLSEAALIKVASIAATGVGKAVSIAGIIVATVRATVRDWIAMAVGQLVSIIAQAFIPPLIPKVLVQVGLKVSQWCGKITQLLRRLGDTISRIAGQSAKLAPIFDDVARGCRQAMQSVGRAAHFSASTHAGIAATNATTTATNPINIGPGGVELNL